MFIYQTLRDTTESIKMTKIHVKWQFPTLSPSDQKAPVSAILKQGLHIPKLAKHMQGAMNHTNTPKRTTLH